MGKDTESEDEKTKLGPLSRDNHEHWFRYEKLKLKSKEVFYVIETTQPDYALTVNDKINGEDVVKETVARQAMEKTKILERSEGSVISSDTEITELINGFEKLGGTYSHEKAREWERD